METTTRLSVLLAIALLGSGLALVGCTVPADDDGDEFPAGIDIERANVSSAGAEAGSTSYGPLDVSSDGRYVAYYSAAANLVADDTNAQVDVFIYDRLTNATERLTLSSSGEEANEWSDRPAMSGDGRFVAYQSLASNLVAGDTNAQYDVFVRDRTSGTTERVSVSSAGAEASGGTPSISANGRYVAFSSAADNLVAGDTNLSQDVFVHDRESGVTERVSVSSAGAEAATSCYTNYGGAISGDGRTVVFNTASGNLVAGDDNSAHDVFVFDRQTDTLERVSVSSAGVQGNADSNSASISASGRFVVFASSATNLVADDTNGAVDIFVYDRQSDTCERVSVNAAGVEANGGSADPFISSDGRFVSFTSSATNLVAGDLNGANDIFVYDRQTDTVQRVSRDASGVEGGAASRYARISSDGRYVAFESSAANLVAGDTNGVADVFVAPVE